MSWKVDEICKQSTSHLCEVLRNITFLDNKPSFGPTYINFYEGIHKNLYYGKLLVSMETEEVDDKVFNTLQQKQDILMPFNESDYWNEEVFRINMILVNIDALNLQQNRMKTYLSCENNFSNSIDLNVNEYEGKMKVKFVYFNSNVRPLMTLNVKLPDNRLKLQVKNLVEMLVNEMVKDFKKFSRVLRAFQNFLWELLRKLLFWQFLSESFTFSFLFRKQTWKAFSCLKLIVMTTLTISSDASICSLAT